MITNKFSLALKQFEIQKIKAQSSLKKTYIDKTDEDENEHGSQQQVVFFNKRCKKMDRQLHSAH